LRDHMWASRNTAMCQDRRHIYVESNRLCGIYCAMAYIFVILAANSRTARETRSTHLFLSRQVHFTSASV
jgi:hypothetical protein